MRPCHSCLDRRGGRALLDLRSRAPTTRCSTRPASRAPHCRPLLEELRGRLADELRQRQVEADRAFLTQGITFTVYGDEQGTERIFPFDLLPRIITAARVADARARPDAAAHRDQPVPEGRLPRGPHPAEGVVPRDLVYSCRHYRREMRGVRVHRDIYVSVAGTDLVRLEDGRFVVLEDNLRVPSGVSYMLANREVTKRVFPGLFDRYNVRPIAHYGQALLATLRALAPPQRRRTRPSWCSRRASATRPTSSTRSSRARWASRWSRGATCSSTTTSSTCARPPGCGASTSSTAASTTTSSIRWRSARDSHLGRRRAAQRLSRRQRVARQRDRHRRRRRQGALCVRSGDHPVLPGRGADPRRTSRRTCSSQAADRPLRARAPRLARRQGGRRVRRLRHADRAAQHGARARGVPRQDPRRPAQLHRAADARAVAGAVLHRRSAIEPRHVDLRPYILYGERRDRSCPAG